jgi:hypothetical protein
MQTDTYDSRFDDAEAEVDRGNPWRFREPDAPNPLTIVATDWTSGHTKLGEAEWLNGTDRDGKRWSILVGAKVLQKRLIEGVVEEWNPEAGRFETVDVQGKVKPREVVSLKYLGEREGATYTYPAFAVVRKPPLEAEPAAAPAGDADGNIPF